MNGWGSLGRGEAWGPGPAGGSRPPGPETMRGVCFCLLYDLCSWLAGTRRAVSDEVDEYTMTELRTVEDPRERLRRYVSPYLLRTWEGALRPFFASGFVLDPELGEAGSFQDHGRDAGGRAKAELRFGNRSSVVDPAQRRQKLPPRDWILTVWLSPKPGRYVENATIRLA